MTGGRTTKTDSELAPSLSLCQVSVGEKNKQAAKFEKLLSDALEHEAADVRFDPPDATTDQNLGPDHRVMKALDALENRTMHDMGNSNAAEQGSDDDVMFSLHESEDDMDVQETHTTTLQEQNEARKEEVLTGIPTKVWQAAKERVNRHEKALHGIVQESLVGIAKIRQRFWGWLLHDRPEKFLTAASVSEATMEEALEQWGITELNFWNMVEVHQEQVMREQNEQVRKAYATLTQPTRVTANRGDNDQEQETPNQASAQTVGDDAFPTQQVSQQAGPSQQVSQDQPT